MVTKVTGPELVREYKASHGGDSLIAFSGGKDSLCVALSIIDKLNVVPFYYYIVPNLPLVEENLDYYERKLFKRRIIRVPHFRLWDWLDSGVHQTMANLRILDAGRFRKPTSDFGRWVRIVHDGLVEQEGLDERALTAIGSRANDSSIRRMAFNKHGAIRPSSQSWYPVWAMDKTGVLEMIQKSGISLPPDYEMFGRSFDGLTIPYLVPIKKHRPKDYQMILDFWPLADVEVWKYERTHGKI